VEHFGLGVFYGVSAFVYLCVIVFFVRVMVLFLFWFFYVGVVIIVVLQGRWYEDHLWFAEWFFCGGEGIWVV